MAQTGLEYYTRALKAFGVEPKPDVATAHFEFVELSSGMHLEFSLIRPHPYVFLIDVGEKKGADIGVSMRPLAVTTERGGTDYFLYKEYSEPPLLASGWVEYADKYEPTVLYEGAMDEVRDAVSTDFGMSDAVYAAHWKCLLEFVRSLEREDGPPFGERYRLEHAFQATKDELNHKAAAE